MEVRGKLPDQIPLFRGHTATVLDTDWNPFDDNVLASSSDDGKIAIWRVPDDYKIVYEDPEEIKDIAPIKKLSGHSRKVGHILWHPVAENILASSSADFTVKIWNVETGEAIYTLPHKDLVTSFTFNYDGSLLATTCRDKKIRVWDIRKEEIVTEGPGHGGAKASRICWLGPYDRLATSGFSRLSDRQFALWDSTDISKGPIGGFTYLDGSSGVCIPYFDEGTHCLYLAGKGDGNIRYFEYENDTFYPLSEFQSSEPQRGIAFLPKRAVNVHEHEVVRVYKSVKDTTIEPIAFIVPRRAETFQEDIYPPAYAGEPALTAEEWISGKNSPPKVFSLEAKFEGTKPTVSVSEASKEIPKPKEVPPSPKATTTKSSSSSAQTSPKKEATRSVSSATVSDPSEKKDMDSLLNGSQNVDKLLAKASTQEEDLPTPLKKEESSWDDEPVSKPAPKKTEESSSSAAISKKEELKPAAPISAEKQPSKSVEKAPSASSNTTTTTTTTTQNKSVNTVKPTEASKSTSTESKTVNGSSLSSSPSTETAASLVEMIKKIDSKFDSLIKELKTRDERIESLEKKIADLLEKKD